MPPKYRRKTKTGAISGVVRKVPLTPEQLAANRAEEVKRLNKKRRIQDVYSWLNDIIESKETPLKDLQEAREILTKLNTESALMKGDIHHATLGSLEKRTTKILTNATSPSNRFGGQSAVVEGGSRPEFLNKADAEAAANQSSTEYRGEVEVRNRGEFGQQRKVWDDTISVAADTLEEKNPSLFNNPDGSPKMSKYSWNQFEGFNKGKSGNLTLKEEWTLSRQMDYGHSGAAGNPAYKYAINWRSNAGPEFALFNRTEGMAETVSEAIETNKKLKANEGLTWTEQNKTRYNKILKELNELGIKLPEGNLDYWKSLKTRNAAPLDIVRDRYHAFTMEGGTGGFQGVLTGKSPTDGRRSAFPADSKKLDAGGILLADKALTYRDSNATQVSNPTWIDKTLGNSSDNVIEIINSTTPEQLAAIEKELTLAQNELKRTKQPFTPDKIASVLKRVGGASTLLLLSNIARADGVGGVEKFINGLNLMEAQTVQGDEAISNIPGVQTVKDLWGGLVNFLNENVQEVNVGPGGTYQAPVENVGYALDAGQNVVNPYWDIAAVTGAMMADQPQDVVTEQQPYYTGSGAQVIDEHDVKVNRGLVRDIWFGNPHND